MEQNKKSSGTHTVMPKKLAEALMDAGMQHFDMGGGIQPTNPFMTMSPVQGPMPNQTSFNVGSGQNPGSDGTPGSIGGAGQQQANALGLSGTPMGNIMTGFDQAFGFNDYNAQTPGITKQNFAPQLFTSQINQNQAYENQKNLAQQLLMQSQGQGPNPAQTQLAQNTGQNVATQGALMASQRGANSNPALMARQAAQTGAGLQQSATGQAATLGAQQQLAAQSGLANVYQQQAQNALQAEQIGQGAQAAQNTAINQGSLGAQTINANTSAQNAQHAGGMFGGILSSAGSMLGFADGGDIPSPSLIPYQQFKDDDSSKSGGGGGGGAGLGALALLALKKGGNVPGKAMKKGNSKENDTVPAMLSPGEIVLPRSVTQSPDMEKKAVEFLRHLKGNKKGSYGDVVAARKYKGGAC